MRRLFNGALIVSFFLVVTTFVACSDDDPIEEITETIPSQPGEDEEENENENENDEPMERNLTITINGTAFTATLSDNNAARAFASMLPMTLNMSELNGNEKYYYLDNDLPTDSQRPGTIHAGDLMLYGSSCVVLFYETFSSGYSYTRLGQIDNPEGLAAAVGNGNVSVRFDVQ